MADFASTQKPPISNAARSAPITVTPDGASVALQRLPLTGSKSESWLQHLIHKWPQILPVGEIEPGFGHLIPAAMEVACKSGYIDNLYLTATGEIALVEAKLWINPQARREVVAQTLDYIAALSSMTYSDFEAAILKARNDGLPSLYALIADKPGAGSKIDFVDAVTRNLKRGRILALIVGDGIREEARELVGFLQSHAGAHFTLALVAIGLWRNPVTDDLIAVPDTLVQTVMIERGVVVIGNDGPAIKPLPAPVATPSVTKTISSEMFDEQLAKLNPGLPKHLHSFLASLSRIGVFTEQKTSLQIFARLRGADAVIKLGYVAKNGQLWTDNVIAAAPSDLAMQYLRTLGAIVDGTIAAGETPYATLANGKSAPPVAAILAHSGSWAGAIEHFVLACETEYSAMMTERTA